jgi:hypothetical protein
MSAHIDVTPPGASLFCTVAETAEPALLLNGSAPQARLLGLALSQTKQLRMMAQMAATGNGSTEAELKEVAEVLWEGLDTLTACLEAMGQQHKEQDA